MKTEQDSDNIEVNRTGLTNNIDLERNTASELTGHFGAQSIPALPQPQPAMANTFAGSGMIPRQPAMDNQQVGMIPGAGFALNTGFAGAPPGSQAALGLHHHGGGDGDGNGRGNGNGGRGGTGGRGGKGSGKSRTGTGNGTATPKAKATMVL